LPIRASCFLALCSCAHEGCSNPTAGKSRRISLRGLGFDRILPRWLGGTGGVSKAQLHSSDVNAEKEEAFVSAGATPESTHRRSFWGTRRVKKAKGSKPYIAEKRQEVPRDAPGGGTLQAARETASTDDGFDPYADDDNASATPLRSPVSPRLDGQDGGFFRSGNSSAASPPHWAKVAWEDLRVGDFVKLRGDEAVPAGALSYVGAQQPLNPRRHRHRVHLRGRERLLRRDQKP
jgi:phospholipid-translocating ATPase